MKSIENKMPLRKDYEYMENFHLFEFTHCITYEFAIRNPNVENILNFLNELFIIYESMIHRLLNSYSRIIQKGEKLKNKKIIETEIKQILFDILENHKLNRLKFKLDDLKISNIRKKIANLIKLLTDELYDKYYIVYQNEFDPDLLHIGEIYWRGRYLERDKELTKHIFYLADDENILDNYKINYGKNNIFTIFETLNKNSNEFTFNSIYPNFTTALRDFTDTKVYLNLKLPFDELKAYLKEIKDDYNKKNSIIKTKLELLEDELELKKDTLSKDKRINWADSFFIYDYYRYNLLFEKKTKEKIKYEIILLLSEYHYVEYFEKDDNGKSKKSIEIKWLDFWDEYIKEEYDEHKEVYGEEMEIDFSYYPNIKPYMEEKAIRSRFEKMEEYIIGDKPKYKLLVES